MSRLTYIVIRDNGGSTWLVARTVGASANSTVVCSCWNIDDASRIALLMQRDIAPSATPVPLRHVAD
jgi:hypothetical protein